MAKAWEAAKTPTMNLVIERIYTLHEGLNEFTSNPRNCRYGIGFARVRQTKLEERFPNKVFFFTKLFMEKSKRGGV